MTERDIFFEALEMGTPEARAAYLQGACGQDVTLRRKVDELLKEHFSNDSLLAGPALDGERPGIVESPVEEVPAQMIGRYKLLEKIGEGGFGEVWMAEQRDPVKRRVALKIIKLGMDSRQIVARFEAERQALAMMDHPNIAKIFDAGTTENPLTPALSPSGGEGGRKAGEGIGYPRPSDGRGAGGEGLATRHSPLATHYGRLYFVMELVRGIKITEYCDQHQLPTRERLRLFILVCQAIQHAHQKGIIHRDIKPSNILVTLHDGVPVPKVIDFGIAKATQQELTDRTVFTQFQHFIGTPAYISPEQAEMSGLDIDTRADIYSLGVLLYELLVGQTPFDVKEMMRGGLDGLRQIIREKEPLRPSTKLSQTLAADALGQRKSTQGLAVPTQEEVHADARRRLRLKEQIAVVRGDLDWIVMKCLEKDRTRRYDTANGLAMDIRRHLSCEPVLARPPSKLYEFQKTVRRHKFGFAAAAAIILVLAVGITLTTWQAVRATRATKGEFDQRIAAQTAQSKAEVEQQRADAQARKAATSEQHSRRLLYASDMNLAQQSLKLNNLGKARQLLDRHRPQPGEEDLRGWEWRYLWQLTRGSALATLTNRPTQGFSVSFSPDGKRLAVGWWDGRVDLWDVPARRWVRALTERELPHPARVAFSSVRNLLAATSGPSEVTLYDLDSGRESVLWRVTDAGGWDVRDLAFSQDGSKLVIYAGSNPESDDAVWVVDVSSAQIESRHPAGRSPKGWTHIGAARLSPDNRRLYLVRCKDWNCSIQCIDLGTSQELWQTPPRDALLLSLDLSPDGRVLVSASGFLDTTIHIWDTTTGEFLIKPLAGHTASVIDLAFTKDGRRLISAADDQTIRFWDTITWTEIQALRGHTDGSWAIAISEAAQLIASTGKDGSFMLWRLDEKRATDGYRRLSESWDTDVHPLDHSRMLLLPPGQPPALVDLKRDTPAVALPGIGSSTNVLGCFDTNLLCVWNGTNQILVGELRGAEFVQGAAIPLDSGVRPTGVAYNPARRLLAWSEGTSSRSLYLASLASAGRRIELRSDVPGLAPFRFGDDGNYLAAAKEPDILRTWNVETGQIVASINQSFSEASRSRGWPDLACFAANGRVLVVAILRTTRNEIEFCNLARPDLAPRRVPGGFFVQRLAVSPNGQLVAASSFDGKVQLFDAAKGELIDSLHGHLNAAFAITFSPDGRRLISTKNGREAVQLWDVGTGQELLTLAGADAFPNKARWSADGDAILAGPPWQAWIAPSWEEIAAAEAKERTEVKRP